MADGTNYQGSHTSTHKVFKVIIQLNIASNIFGGYLVNAIVHT